MTLVDVDIAASEIIRLPISLINEPASIVAVSVAAEGAAMLFPVH